MEGWNKNYVKGWQLIVSLIDKILEYVIAFCMKLYFSFH